MRRALIAAVALLAVACGGGVKSGEVVDKSYSAEMFVPAVKAGDVFIPAQYHPERWSVKLEDCSSGPCEHGWVSVDEATYDRLQPGHLYDSEPDA